LQGLQDELRSVEDQISTIDRTIALGGCGA